MSVQTQSYIEDMKKMYETIIKKKELSLIELSFLDMYKKTIEGCCVNE
jgi:hypothetical protein